jgi:hypothetical protein
LEATASSAAGSKVQPDAGKQAAMTALAARLRWEKVRRLMGFSPLGFERFARNGMSP